MTHDPESGRKLSAGSWAVILYAGMIFALLVALHVYGWNLPTDGWSMRPGGDDVAHTYGELQANLAGLPSELRPGDRVTAVDGVPIVEMLNRAYRFWRYTPPDWHDGETLRYTVSRGEDTLDVDVPVSSIGAAGHIRASLTTAVGVINPVAAMLEVLASLAFALVSLFVFVVRPREPASGALLIIGSAFFFQHYWLVGSLPILVYPFAAYSFLFISTWVLAILPAFLYLTLAFPRPKRIVRRFPRGTPVLVFGFAFLIQLGPFLIYAADTLKALALQRSTSFASFLYLALPVVAIAHSFLTERNPAARAQLKWVTLGIIGFIVGGLAFSAGTFGEWTLATSLVQNAGYLMLPVCIGIAVVRHRLFDIDLIIRRTLVYAIVTAVLAGVFYGAVLVLQRLFTIISGQTSPIALVASTLAIAALFSPLRRRVQDFVDRRFYRRKYDAARVLSDFGRVARSETDVDALSGALTAALQETTQPSRLGIWLQTDQRK